MMIVCPDYGESTERHGTYFVEPGHLVGFGVRLDVALKVHVVALFYVVRIQIGSHFKCHRGRICGRHEQEELESRVVFHNSAVSIVAIYINFPPQRRPLPFSYSSCSNNNEDIVN